jgi:hypothetical protein
LDFGKYERAHDIYVPKSSKLMSTLHWKKMWNPYYEICNCTTKSIVYPYYSHTISIRPYGNIQLLWITKIHSISNKGPYNFHSMTFYGFSLLDVVIYMSRRKPKLNWRYFYWIALSVINCLSGRGRYTTE